MKIANIQVPFYKWRITTILLQSQKDFAPLLKKLRNTYQLADKYYSDLSDKLKLLPYDGAVVYYNEGKLLILVIIYQHKSKSELRNTIIHEGSHAADKIIESCGLEGTEARAYLTEYVCSRMLDGIILNKKKG